MESESDLKHLQQSLDQVTFEFFDTLESLYQSQARLESFMRGGFLSLSRARYSMGGTRNVGALQFAKNEKEMEAVSVVDVSAKEDCRSGKADGHAWLSTEISLVEKQLGTTTKIDSKKTEKSEDLRQRKGQKILPEDEKDKVETIGMQNNTTEAETTAESKGSQCLKDPLTLFGVLVSPHLRHSQASFKQAVAVVVEIANLKNKLQGLQQKFQLLMAQKRIAIES